ncbi:MAG: hypothetical protein M3082_17605 [Candidatus Dormibacteraeota bacterium]|nr:hypothetical protein [Candidatus Dormibacteraeota bacterium]
MSDALFWSTLLLLGASTLWTIWRMRGAISAAVLVPLAWILLIPIPVVIRPWVVTPKSLFPEGFVGAPRTHLFISIAVANLAFVGFQWLILSPWFKALQARALAFFGTGEQPGSGRDDSLLRKWVIGLTLIAVALAVFHLAVMPRIPAWDLVTGFADPLQPNYDREAADKFLPVPTIVKYIFNWNQSIVFPILFALVVLMRWRPMAIFIGIFGFLYVTSTLAKFPSLLFLAAPFIAIAVRDNRPIWSKLVIGGLAVSLLGPLALNQSTGISTAIHKALHDVPPASSTPVYDPSITTPVPGCESYVAPTAVPFSWRNIPASLKDIVVRRIGVVPAEVTYGWFAYFPAQHPFLNGSGWEPWKVLAKGYHNPANLVGLWMYCGHALTLPTVSAYGSLIADGWGELGYLGVVLACLGIVFFGIVMELIRSFVAKPFLIACYGPSILLFATLPPRAGILATILSSGLWLVPLLCLLFLATEGLRGRRTGRVTGLERARA